MDRRAFLVSSGLVLTGGAVTSLADKSQGSGAVSVEVEGQLVSLLRQENSKAVTAVIGAGGGELVIDSSGNPEVRKELVRLAEKYIKLGSSSVILPRLKVKGRLEFRATKVVGEKGRLTEGAGMWVLVADSVKVTEARDKIAS